MLTDPQRSLTISKRTKQITFQLLPLGNIDVQTDTHTLNIR